MKAEKRSTVGELLGNNLQKGATESDWLSNDAKTSVP